MFSNKFIENFLSLTMLRGLTLIVPLVTYPYLIRILGSEKYGLIMWAWSIVNFFILFINFGFGLSVTKYVALHRDDKKKLSEIISTTIATKFVLFVMAFLIFLILLYTVPKMAQYRELFFWTFALTLGETMMPIWYFQGIEKMKYTAVITSFVKIGFAILVFLIIQKQDDYLKVPILYALASIVSALFAYYLIFIKDKNSLVLPKITNILFYIKDSTALFLSSSISVLKDSLMIVFIEHFIGLSSVAYFDIVQKFINILITPFHIVATVLFPHLSKTKDYRLLKKVMVATTFVALMFVGLVWVFDSQITQLLYGKQNEQIQQMLYVMVFAIIFANLASLLGTNGLVVASRNKKLFIASVVGAIGFVSILTMLWFTKNIALIMMAYVVVVTYMIDVLTRGYFMKGLIWYKK